VNRLSQGEKWVLVHPDCGKYDSSVFIHQIPSLNNHQPKSWVLYYPDMSFAHLMDGIKNSDLPFIPNGMSLANGDVSRGYARQRETPL
jgi:hypothetical protein